MQYDTSFEPEVTVFILVKTSPEWLAFAFETRLEHARTTFAPILEEFRDEIRLGWYDVEFYSAVATDVWMIDAKSHRGYQLFCERLRETPFWDRFFIVETILPGERNAWAKNYAVAPLAS